MANWPAMRPTFTTGEVAGEGQHHRHLQEDAEEVADVVGAVLGEALGAVAALQQESLAVRDVSKPGFELARLACKNQRRIGGEPRLDGGERRQVGIDRRLLDRQLAPGRGCPLLAHYLRTPTNIEQPETGRIWRALYAFAAQGANNRARLKASALVGIAPADAMMDIVVVACRARCRRSGTSARRRPRSSR